MRKTGLVLFISSLSAVVASTLRNLTRPLIPETFGDSVFKNASEYASWTQYLCRTIFRAKAMPFLDKMVPRLRALIPQLTAEEAGIAANTVGFLTSIMDRWQFEPQPLYSQLDGEHADRLLLLLARGKFAQVKFEAENLIHHESPLQLPHLLKKILIITGLIQYDVSVPHAPLPLWSFFWNLSDDQMIGALFRAGQLTQASHHGGVAPEVLPPSYPEVYDPLYDVRPMINLGLPMSRQVAMAPGLDLLENALVSSAKELGYSKSCLTLSLLDQATKMAPNLTAQMEISEFRKRLSEMCIRRQLENTFKTFCQVGNDTPFPVSEAMSAYDKGAALIANKAEKAFWIRLAAGDCSNASVELQTLESSLHPELLQRRRYLGRRLKYMHKRLSQCQSTPDLYVQEFGLTMMRALLDGNIAEAESLWQEHFLMPNEDRLAMAWKQAIIVANYPKVIFNPCTGNSLLSGVALLDKRLFARLDHIAKNKPPSTCWNLNPTSKDVCNYLWLKAYYIAGDVAKVEHYASLISYNKKLIKETQLIKSCAALCNYKVDSLQACHASELYHQIPLEDQRTSYFRIGSDLASRMCRLAGTPEPDWFYLRYGPSPKPMGQIIETYIAHQTYHPVLQSSATRTLKDQFALAVAKSVICPCRKAEFLQGFSLKRLGCNRVKEFVEEIKSALPLSPSESNPKHHLKVKVDRLAQTGYLQEASDLFATEDSCNCLNYQVMRKYGVK